MLMSNHLGEPHSEDLFANIAFGVLVTSVGAVVVKKLLEKGRQRHSVGEPGVIYSDADQERTIAVKSDAVHFQAGAFGVLSVSHETADALLADIAAAEQPRNATRD